MIRIGGGSDEKNSSRPLIDMFEDGSDLHHRTMSRATAQGGIPVGHEAEAAEVGEHAHSRTSHTITGMPIVKPPPTGAVKSRSSNKNTFWTDFAGTQLQKSNYEYTKLGENKFRILRLHAADSSAEPIECSLEMCDIDELSNSYNAVSYTWGNEEPTKKILVRTPQELTTSAGKSRFKSFAQGMIKKHIYIRPHLEDALRTFRDTHPNTQQDQLLWIDAICINQTNEEEKSMQVARMAEIFSKAQDVLIWLGNEYNASSMAMEFIPKILDLEESAALISKESNRKQWTALADLMKRDWFSRRWVVQELILAKGRYLYCGDRSLHWSDFERAVSFFKKNLDDITAMFTSSTEFRHSGKMLADLRAHGATALVDITNENSRYNEDGSLERLSSLESLVASSPMFESTDPRDIVYSLLSIAKDTQNWNTLSARRQDELRGQGLVPFEANYGKDILEVFKDFTAFCIQTSGSLDIICRHWAPSQYRKPNMMYRMKMRAMMKADSIPGDFTSNEDISPIVKIHLPSWIGLLFESPYGVPDVGRSAGESLVGGPNNAGRYHASAKTPPSVYFGEIDASLNQDSETTRFRDDSPRPDFSKYKVSAKETLKGGVKRLSDGSLYVKGVTIDVLEQVSHRLFEGLIPAEWLQIAGRIEPGSGATKEIPHHFWRTLVADRDPNGGLAPKWYYTALDNALTKRNSNGDLITTDLIRHGQPKDMVTFLQRAQDVIWNRKFFLLKRDGKPRFGLAPTKAQKGDILCILFGCSVPVVLRKVETSGKKTSGKETSGEPAFKLIGEAFVYGLMEGQAVNELPQDFKGTEYRLV